MKQVSPGTKTVSGTCTIVSAAEGKVKYLWQTGDVDTAGVFRGEFEVTYPDLTVQTVPADSGGYIDIKIWDDLG